MCACVCVLLWSWWASSESTFQHGWKTPPLVFVSQNRTALPSLSCGPRRRHQSSTRVLPPVFQYIQNSGYHPLFIAITSMEKKSSWGFALSSGSVLVVGESFQSGNWVTSTVQREPLICWDCISAKEIHICSSVFISESWKPPLKPTAGPLQGHCGHTWDTMVQCKVYTELYSTGTP